MKRYVKKIIFFVVVAMMSMTMFAPAFANGEISVYLDDEKIQFDVAPLLIDGRTMVPMRAIFEKLGANVDWDNNTRTAIAKKGDINISIAIDDTILYKIEYNDEKLQALYSSLPEASGIWLKAQHILIQKTDDGKGLSKAKTILSDLKKNPSKFEEYMGKYNEDPGVANQPDGYIFNEGMMVDEFYNGALHLKEGAISEIVESIYGYHIIKKVKQWNNGVPYTEIEKQVKETYLYSNIEEIKLDVPAQLVGGRTLVPLRAVSEAFDCEVQWNGDTQTVNIYSTVSNQAEEIIHIEPPKNIRVVRQEKGSAHIQWDEVEGAEYYHFYYQEAGEDTFWFDEDDNGNKLKFEYCDDYTVSYNGLENGKTYKVIVTSVKNGVESNDSKILTFIYNSFASQEKAFNELKTFIIENQNGIFNGSDPSYTIKRNDESAYLWEYTLVFEETFNTITVKERIVYDNQQNIAFMQLRSDDIPSLCMFANTTLYNHSDSSKFTGTYTIDPKTFTKNSTIVFSEVEGNAFEQEYYANLAKHMNLDMLNFLDFIYHTDLSDTGCSMSDFGFEVETSGNSINGNVNNYPSENNAPTNNYQGGGGYSTNTKITLASFPLYIC